MQIAPPLQLSSRLVELAELIPLSSDKMQMKMEPALVQITRQPLSNVNLGKLFEVR